MLKCIVNQQFAHCKISYFFLEICTKSELAYFAFGYAMQSIQMSGSIV